MGLNRYFAYTIADFKHHLSHRAMIITRLLAIPLSILTMFIVWNVVYDYNDSSVIGLFNRNQMINYSILSITMSLIVYTDADRRLGWRIISGDLIKDLVKPEQFYWSFLFRNLGYRLNVLILEVAPALIISALFFGFKASSITFTLLSVISFSLAFLLNYSFSLLFGLIGFKVTYYGQLNWLKQAIVSFLAGSMISLTLLPLPVQQLMDYLPFQHMLYTPIRMFIGSYDLFRALLYIAIQLSWFIVFFVLMKYLWHKAVKSFEGAGA